MMMRTFCALVVLSLAACGESRSPGPLDFTTELPEAPTEMFMDVANAIPSFAGAYGEDGKLIVLLTAEATPEDETAALEWGRKQAHHPRGVALGRAEFSWLTLVDAKVRGGEVIWVEGTVSYDVDERANRVVVGVVDEAVGARVQNAWSANGLAPELLVVEQQAPFQLL